MKISLVLAISLFSVPLVGHSASPVFPALQTKAVADKNLATTTREGLISIVGPRSETEILPDVWVYQYFDPAARQSGRQITVTRGAVTKILEGYTDLNRFRIAAFKEQEVMKLNTLKIDSTKAFETLKQAGQFKGISLSSVTFDLRLGDDGETPVWKLEVLADRDGNEVNIGFARISAVTGLILELKLDLEKAKK